MDFDAIGEIFDYWQANPPPAELLALVAQFIGWKRPEPPGAGGDLAELLAMFPSGRIG